MRFLSPDISPVEAPASQLVVTLGPRSLVHAREMAEAGATAFRLNASHLEPPALADALALIALECPAAVVVVDLQGAKMRLGRITPRSIAAGEHLRFSLDGHWGLLLPHREIYLQVRRGQTISIDDGRLRLEVTSVHDEVLEARALTAGTLEPRKGVNVEEHPVALTALTSADAATLDVAAAGGVSAFAFSFMTTGLEADWVRERVPGCLVIGKIERAEAARDLEVVASRVDATWICRGDLGVQLGAAGLARFVAGLSPRALGNPVLMAGQVLQHLVDHDQPTRSEVCHLHDLLSRGFGGIVLSDETAIGDHPVRAVRLASDLMEALGVDGRRLPGHSAHGRE